MRIGNTAFSRPSTTAHPVRARMLSPACSGAIIPSGEAAKRASNTVTTSVNKALLCPAILKPSIKTKSNTMGTIEIIDAISYSDFMFLPANITIFFENSIYSF